jgi:hypothetical protein
MPVSSGPARPSNRHAAVIAPSVSEPEADERPRLAGIWRSRRRAAAYRCQKNTLTSKRSTTLPPGPAGREPTERVSRGGIGGLLPGVVCQPSPAPLTPGVACPPLFAGVDRERKVPGMSEFETIGLEPVESLTITTLVDNVTDILLLDEGPAIRAPIDSRGLRARSVDREADGAWERGSCPWNVAQAHNCLVA